MDLLQTEEFLTDVNCVVEFKLVKTGEDLLRDDIAFEPDKCHHIFGGRVNIYGYKGLRVKICYSAGWLKIYCGIEYTHKLDDVEDTDILNIIRSKYGLPIIENMELFKLLLLEENTFKPFGTLLSTYNCPLGDSGDEYTTYEFFLCSNEIPGFRIYQQRQQTFLMWFIDGANPVDIDDSAWKFFVVYEKYKRSDNNIGYAFVGLSNVYEFYGYPFAIRPRFSQVLVLPPYQFKGIGAKLLHTIYNYYSSKNNVLDFTVQDPTEDFQCLRDFVDCTRVSISRSFVRGNVIQRRREELVCEMHNAFKLNKKQAQRIYEIFRMMTINWSNEKELRNFRIEIMRRLYHEFMGKVKKLVRSSSIVPEEKIEEYIIGPRERKAKLENSFSELLLQYQRVIDRLLSTRCDELY